VTDQARRDEVGLGGIMCRCPHCGSDLRGPEISRTWYLAYGYDPDGRPATCRDGCGHPPHYSRLGSVYDRWRDRTVAWQCPDCGRKWQR
jgi:predicted RNA-binding Zn-ribbon protein involved in translation (DUF1610 family)